MYCTHSLAFLYSCENTYTGNRVADWYHTQHQTVHYVRQHTLKSCRFQYPQAMQLKNNITACWIFNHHCKFCNRC